MNKLTNNYILNKIIKLQYLIKKLINNNEIVYFKLIL